jgi:hypothetical protein
LFIDESIRVRSWSRAVGSCGENEHHHDAKPALPLSQSLCVGPRQTPFLVAGRSRAAWSDGAGSNLKRDAPRGWPPSFSSLLPLAVPACRRLLPVLLQPPEFASLSKRVLLLERSCVGLGDDDGSLWAMMVSYGRCLKTYPADPLPLSASYCCYSFGKMAGLPEPEDLGQIRCSSLVIVLGIPRCGLGRSMSRHDRERMGTEMFQPYSLFRRQRHRPSEFCGGDAGDASRYFAHFTPIHDVGASEGHLLLRLCNRHPCHVRFDAC